MAKKRKTLPKNFDELIEKKDIENLKKVFDTCELDARGGYGKQTALSFYHIPDEMVRWLVEKGAELEAKDIYERTALHNQAMMRTGHIGVLLALGANVSAIDKYGDTPLHFAAGSGFNVDAVKSLLEYNADVKALNDRKQTPLEKALANASNMDLESLADISMILLSTGIGITSRMQEAVIRLGENFEFHREYFNKDFLPQTDKALSRLYEMYDVTPVKRRIMHDGISPIAVNGKTWEERFEALWELLVPSRGSAGTVQGEVVRIAGKVRDEIYRNGGGNWDKNFRKMLDAYLLHLSSGNTLTAVEMEKAHQLIPEIQKNGFADDLNFLCDLATKWVFINPDPITLEQPGYSR